MKRPWDGQTENVHNKIGPEFDPTNPLCPGVVRSSGIVSTQFFMVQLYFSMFDFNCFFFIVDSRVQIYICIYK